MDTKTSCSWSATCISVSHFEILQIVFSWMQKWNWKVQKVLAVSPSNRPWNPRPPFACFAMQAASWPRGSGSITPQQQFHFPAEAKQFQSLEMFLITSVVYECYMISKVHIKNICSFQNFLNFSQKSVHELPPQPLSLSSYTVFLTVTWTWVSSFWSSKVNFCIILQLWKKKNLVKIFQPDLIYYPL